MNALAEGAEAPASTGQAAGPPLDLPLESNRSSSALAAVRTTSTGSL